MKRQVSYQWRLREVMATRGIFNATDLSPLLFRRGIELSSVQVWRLVAQVPERLSLPVLAALCDILDVTPTDLIATRAEAVTPRRTADGGAEIVDLATTIRPKRARITPER
ncbi:DNA-binding Xre family transcriptional regulator [Arthrobacter stackebrandtii]|uniref:DNA-binding Xre family transcriptional regulator n=1 Tax=Arthrobacter stackebrandtii TaxID=272161 RepID=A0ABS4YXQ6_9MICC|nr:MULTISPECIES: helix-turn-helix transcriptional regulator [Arthrobacter]MBP2413240.1 DNA-binding Xre family transcriptional regulator [Arthrobacter stackebrandtii]PYH01014.1 XRE family transcriptional regulator [Arthrobacter stackebrandtii]